MVDPLDLNQKVIGVTDPSALPQLQRGIGGGMAVRHPRARAVFGIYKSPLIYIREVH